MSTSTTIATDYWSLPLPEGWAAENCGRTIAVFRRDGVGAVNISAARRPGEPVTEDDLRDLLADELKGAAATPKLVTVGEFRGITAQYQARGGCWQAWLLGYRDTWVYVTYNCDAKHLGVEAQAVDELVSGLSPAARPAG